MRSLRSEVSVIFVVALAFTALSSVRSEYTWNGSEWVWSETSETKVCIDWIWFLCISSQIFFVKLKCVKFSPILGRGNRSFCQIKTSKKKCRKIYILKEKRGNMPRSIWKQRGIERPTLCFVLISLNWLVPKVMLNVIWEWRYGVFNFPKKTTQKFDEFLP
jgi:hypothetical protein